MAAETHTESLEAVALRPVRPLFPEAWGWGRGGGGWRHCPPHHPPLGFCRPAPASRGAWGPSPPPPPPPVPVHRLLWTCNGLLPACKPPSLTASPLHTRRSCFSKVGQVSRSQVFGRILCPPPGSPLPIRPPAPPTPLALSPRVLNTGCGAHKPSPGARANPAGVSPAGWLGPGLLPVQTPFCRMKPVGHQARPTLLGAPEPRRRETQAWEEPLGRGARGRSQGPKGPRWLRVVTFWLLRSSGTQVLPSRRRV